MNYYACSFTNPDNENLKDMFMELLGEIGFDSFMDTDDGFDAYCQEPLLNEEELNDILQMEQFANVKLIKKELIPDQDWNATWEASYEPVIINEFCRIRAPFHKVEGSYKYDLIIEPKMSFGTAHHETTSQIIELMLQSDFSGLNLLDMGSGTGVLAILAKKLGSATTVAIDNDEWAYRNALDNIRLNDENEIIATAGDALFAKKMGGGSIGSLGSSHLGKGIVPFAWDKTFNKGLHTYCKRFHVDFAYFIF